MDGSKVHFFYRTINAYATGQRKRRKIQSDQGLTMENVRWHKTGKTRPIVVNGVHKGWKKIMVLYKISKKGCKPNISNWKMHQYHLGTEEDEKEGEFVVSKIFYELQKQGNRNAETSAAEDPSSSPKTPKTNAPSFVVGKASPIEHVDNSITPLGDDKECNKWLAGESQPCDDHDFQEVDVSLLCHETIDPHPHSSDQGPNQVDYSSLRGASELTGTYNAPCGLSDLEKLEFDSLPDFLHNVSIFFIKELVSQLYSTSQSQT